MLTLDLLRYRIKDDCVEPFFINPIPRSKYFQAAQALLQIYRAHVGKTRGELESALDEFTGADVHYKVYRGLAKIVDDNSVIEPVSCDSDSLRMAFFERLKPLRPIVRTADLVFPTSTKQAVEKVATDMGLSAEELDRMLYADLPENHVVREVDRTLTPLSLIERYNVALAQAMLYRAVRAEIRLRDNFRMVFSWMKLARLMHTIDPLPNEGYRIVLDGPVSLFQNSERYGVNMARFLPALLLSKSWELEATVETGRVGKKTFRLNPSHNLRPAKKPQPDFDSSAEEAFYRKFARNKKSKWTITREGGVLSHDGVVFIPDFAFRHEDGRTAFLEIVGFWTPEYLKNKLSKLKRFEKENVIVAVPEVLNCARDSFSGPVISFKARLLLKDVLPALDAIPASEPAPSR